jgi:hypothetical protein
MMFRLRTFTFALVLVAAQGCRKPSSERHADKAAAKAVDATAEFAARRELRYRGLEAQLQVIALQPVVITSLADAFPLTEPGRAAVTGKLRELQMRLDEARNQLGVVHTTVVDAFKDADDKAQDAMNKLEAARKDAWDALDRAPRTDRSS